MKNVTSSIPRDAVEKAVRVPNQKGVLHDHQVTDCFSKGMYVGQRVYNAEGVMILETPLKDGLKHGRELTWDDDGRLLLVEPYVRGKIHGMAKQYGTDGKVIGTYELIHGTGLDIWRQEYEDRTIFISEIHSLLDGVPHGFEWYFASPKQDLWQERSWYRGKIHGIERIWNRQGKLHRGYPKFYVLDQEVPRQRYVKFAVTDKTLPVYKKADNLPHRNFPAEIQPVLVL